MTSRLKQILAESTKTYPFKIGVAGDLPEGFADHLESALDKFVVVKMSNGKKTPIQSVPLDFPNMTNCEVTVFETTLNYPTTQNELRAYLSSVLNTQDDFIRVRKPGEPYEEYQSEKEDKPYEDKLLDGEYKDAPEVDKDKLVTTEKGKETFLQQLAKEQKERHQGDA